MVDLTAWRKRQDENDAAFIKQAGRERFVESCREDLRRLTGDDAPRHRDLSGEVVYDATVARLRGIVGTPNLDGPFTLAGWAYDPVSDVWRPRAPSAAEMRALLPYKEPSPALKNLLRSIQNAPWEVVAADDPTPPATDVDRVIDQLDRRIVPPHDHTRLREAVDRADAPLGGRAGADQAVGRALR